MINTVNLQAAQVHVQMDGGILQSARTIGGIASPMLEGDPFGQIIANMVQQSSEDQENSTIPQDIAVLPAMQKRPRSEGGLAISAEAVLAAMLNAVPQTPNMDRLSENSNSEMLSDQSTDAMNLCRIQNRVQTSADFSMLFPILEESAGNAVELLANGEVNPYINVGQALDMVAQTAERNVGEITDKLTPKEIDVGIMVNQDAKATVGAETTVRQAAGVTIEATIPATNEARNEAPMEATIPATNEARNEAPMEAIIPATNVARNEAPMEAIIPARMEAIIPATNVARNEAPMEATIPARMEAIIPATNVARNEAPMEAIIPATMEAVAVVVPAFAQAGEAGVRQKVASNKTNSFATELKSETLHAFTEEPTMTTQQSGESSSAKNGETPEHQVLTFGRQFRAAVTAVKAQLQKQGGVNGEEIDVDKLQGQVDRQRTSFSGIEVKKAEIPTQEPKLMDQLKTGITQKIAAGEKEFVMKLRPEALGEITVKLVEKGGKTALTIVAANAQTTKLINEDLSLLREVLRPMQVEVKEAVQRTGEASQNQLNFNMSGQQFSGRRQSFAENQQSAPYYAGSFEEEELPDDGEQTQENRYILI